MVVFEKRSSVRGILMVLACTLVSISFAFSTHLVPQGLRKLITIDHQVRRVLLRAERENLRSGVSIQKTGGINNFPHEQSQASPTLKVFVRRFSIPLVSATWTEPKNFVFKLSPVLNL
jgi:hypothetical protein